MTLVVGITGGIGSGKSAVAALFSEFGAEVLDADALAREVVLEAEVLEALVARFGEEIRSEAGGLDRAAMADLVFGEGEEARQARRDLEKIIHPAVRTRLRADLEAARQAGRGLVILDVPLLLTSPFREDCDRIVFVRTKRATRLERVRQRGWDARELDRREAAQVSLEDKECAADRVFDNDGDIHRLRADVKAFVESLGEA